MVTCFQVYLDFRSEVTKIDDRIKQIIQVSHSSAKRAVYTLDSNLANEVVRGLITYPFISSASIYDEDGTPMAILAKQISPTKTSSITKTLKGKESRHIQLLMNSNNTLEGKLIIIVDNDLTFRPLYRRALNSFFSGLIRNIVLGLILAALFHHLLTRPLFGLAKNIANIDYRTTQGKRIASIPHHTNDEIGHIVNSTNTLITQLEDHQQNLEEQEKQLRIILNASPNQVFAVSSGGDIVFSNITTAHFYGQETDDLRGMNYFGLLRNINPREASDIIRIIENTEENDRSGCIVDQCLTDAKGTDHVMQMTFMPFSLYGQHCILVIANDISARVAAEERVEKLAYYDALTSLPNRNQLHEQLISDIEHTKIHGTYGAVLFIDIDDFKRINDTLGHSIGDDLLLQLSIKMKAQLRESETLARLGGDEFILSVPRISNDAESAIEHAEHLAERLLKAISSPIELSSHFFSIGASIGIATYPTVAQNVEQLLRYADTAMYQAKAAGRNCYRVFAAPMEEEARARVRMESEIRQGISNQEFRFHLQPLVHAATHSTCGAEALIRWEHPQKGRIMPGQFIPFLEQSPMVSQVGAQLLDQVCGFLKASRDSGRLPPGFRISVNVSATEFFQPNFVEHVRATLKKHDLSGEFLELEITETVALEGFENVINRMSELKRDGITFALDDFGTGFSSLNYLKQLPVDKIKIDKSFIDGVPINKQDSALVTSVIEIANNLNLSVVVEGVEAKVQAEYFGLLEHIIIQGYWFDAPMSPSDFVDKYLNTTNTEDS